jgi:hypothetical protein
MPSPCKKRLSFARQMEEFGVAVGGKHHKDFFEYLSLQCNYALQWQYILFATGKFDSLKTKEILGKIYQDFQDNQNIITFEELFEVNPEWREYFKENVDSFGIPFPHEKRKGVSRRYVDDICVIQGKCVISLEEAIKMHMAVVLKVRMIGGF